jgi:cytochrome P450
MASNALVRAAQSRIAEGWEATGKYLRTTLSNMITYDVADPRWSSEPGPLFDQIREENPIHKSAQGFWVLSRHQDCLNILRSRQSSSDATKQRPAYAPKGLNSVEQKADGESEMDEVVEDARPFLFRDPPDHTRLRGLVAKAFTPKMVNELLPFVEERTNELLDACLGSGTVDLQQALCYPLPVAVICKMLGVPEEDETRFSKWSELLARGLDPDFLLPPEVLEARNLAVTEFTGYFFELLAERKKNLGDDLLSALVVAEEHGDKLTEVEMLSTSILLLVAGHETTVNLMTGSVVAFAAHPEAQEQLRKNPSLWPSAVDELMRYVSPVQLTGRTLLEDVTLDDQTIPGGSFAMLLLGGANRDPRVFENPTGLTLDRSPNHQLGFGFGLHHCLGAPLARLEARVTMAKLLERTSSIELTAPVTYRPNIVLRGVTELNVALTTR